MVHRLSQDDIEVLRRAFSMYDQNGDGEIDATELKGVMWRLGCKPSDAEVREMIRKVDFDNSGTINFPEFMSMMVQKKRHAETDANLRIAFQFFDRNGDGYISPEELRSVLHKYRGNLDNNETEAIIKTVDTDRDGKLNYEEFLTLLRNQ
ncbi:Calmodulin/ calcium-binding protein/ EF-Hand superfamily protein [Fasciola gigantica]|uniref:Calmodulin/ calcium-binding protein/ EF-Hand superfamily protein n=1 Tax=Fasciola gigantica TaxID=46835 RepID=A0A504YB38_FASGI|nr:Calmodulin/ calcium-binding protein/ EF-Hand superfamily protein [Fasciola gigantica]